MQGLCLNVNSIYQYYSMSLLTCFGTNRSEFSTLKSRLTIIDAVVRKRQNEWCSHILLLTPRSNNSKTSECNDSCMLRHPITNCMACHTQLPLGCPGHQTCRKGGQAGAKIRWYLIQLNLVTNDLCWQDIHELLLYTMSRHNSLSHGFILLGISS